MATKKRTTQGRVTPKKQVSLKKVSTKKRPPVTSTSTKRTSGLLPVVSSADSTKRTATGTEWSFTVATLIFRWSQGASSTRFMLRIA